MSNSTVIFSFTEGMLHILLSLLVFIWIVLVSYTLNVTIYRNHAGWKFWTLAGWVYLLSPVIFGIIAYVTMGVFRAYLIFVVPVVMLIFLWYTWDYCIVFWRPLLKLYGKIHHIPKAETDELDLGLSYCLHRFLLFWSWNGYSRGKAEILKNRYNRREK